MHSTIRRAGLLAALALAAGAAAPASAPAKTIWLCSPKLADDPCRISRTATIHSLRGEVEGTRRFPASGLRRRADCFYVYPTVSQQPGANADRSIDAEQVAIAEWQASRYSQHCRVFAPMYRQRTLAAIADPTVDEEAALQLAYEDVRAAWRAYLRRHNRGHPYILIGHSQGTRMLRRLGSEEIDPRPALRRRLVSAVLLGQNVLVRKGRTRGGDFDHIPACTRPAQFGCVIAWSTFNYAPPPNARFGRTEEPGMEVLCTDPAALSGDPGEPYETFYREGGFPGVIGVGITATNALGPPPPEVETPWLVPPDRYTGECVREDGASYLMIEPVGSSRHLLFFPDPNWGLHLTDANIALGNLVRIVGAQLRAFLRVR